MKNTLTGRGVIFWLLSFFGIIFAVNAVFIVVAVKTFTGDDADNSYLQGVEYNHTLALRAEQEKLGWHATIGADRLSTGKVRIGVLLKQADGTPETEINLVGTLHHPSDETKDKPMRLRQITPGEYVADLGNVATGAWDVIVTTPTKAATPFKQVGAYGCPDARATRCRYCRRSFAVRPQRQGGSFDIRSRGNRCQMRQLHRQDRSGGHGDRRCHERTPQSLDRQACRRVDRRRGFSTLRDPTRARSWLCGAALRRRDHAR